MEGVERGEQRTRFAAVLRADQTNPGDRITQVHIQSWHDSLLLPYTDHNGKKRTRSAHSVKTYVTVVSAFFNWLVAKNKARSNPAKKINRVETSTCGRENFCTREQRDQLIDNCKDPELKLILFLGFHAGLRKNEIVEAIPGWVRLDDWVLELRKTPTIDFKDGEGFFAVKCG